MVKGRCLISGRQRPFRKLAGYGFQTGSPLLAAAEVSFVKGTPKGLTAKDRVLKILRGFLANEAIPPVEVVELLPPVAPYRYKLTNGTHRFYLSIAAGFRQIPAVDGFDINSEY
ncbi:MAG: hypothetical protein ACJ71W_07345 [Terriglobales bacterium]